MVFLERTDRDCAACDPGTGSAEVEQLWDTCLLAFALLSDYEGPDRTLECVVLVDDIPYAVSTWLGTPDHGWTPVSGKSFTLSVAAREALGADDCARHGVYSCLAVLLRGVLGCNYLERILFPLATGSADCSAVLLDAYVQTDLEELNALGSLEAVRRRVCEDLRYSACAHLAAALTVVPSDDLYGALVGLESALCGCAALSSFVSTLTWCTPTTAVR